MTKDATDVNHYFEEYGNNEGELRLTDQPVADRGFVDDDGRVGRIGFELLPKAADRDAEIFDLLFLGGSPDGAEEMGVGEDSAGVLCEFREDAIFLGGDLLADGDGSGHHAALVNLVNIGAPIADGVTIYGELWTMTNFDPADTITLASADVAATYLASPDLQLDLGANLGLTRSTADAEFYVGLSLRF